MKTPPKGPAKKAAKKSVSAAQALAPFGIKPGDLLTLPTGAKRQTGVAGSHDSEFPARYELISTIGLRRVAEACSTADMNSAGDLNAVLTDIEKFRAGNKVRDRLAFAALGLMCLMQGQKAESLKETIVPLRIIKPSAKVKRPVQVVARYDLVPTEGLRRLAETYGEGSLKYTDDNWHKGMEDKGLINHALAHLVQYRTGDQSEDHLAHALWNLMTTMHFQETRPDLMTLHTGLPEGAHR